MNQWIAACVLALAACTPVCDGKKFHVQNGTSASIPGITPKTTVHVGDINVGAVADRIQVRNEAGDVLADQTLVESGARLPFSAGGHRYELNVERIEHHLTSTDFAHFCLVTLE